MQVDDGVDIPQDEYEVTDDEEMESHIEQEMEAQELIDYEDDEVEYQEQLHQQVMLEVKEQLSSLMQLMALTEYLIHLLDEQ